MRKMILLAVGPVNISTEVRRALLLPDICHREVEFTEILKRIRERLNIIFRGNNEYSTIVFGGSGTASLEAVISSVVRRGKLLVLSNGYYGEKLERIGRICGINTQILKYNWGERIKEAAVEKILKTDPEIDFVAMVHNETSVGILNQVHAIGELTSKYERKFIVDAISSIGAEDIDVIRDHIHFCIGSPNKCIESVPGLSFVCADREQLEKLKNLPPKTSYLDLYAQYVHEEGLGDRPGTPFTPPVQVFYALDTALNLLLEEGIENRRKRYGSMAKKIREGSQELGLRLFLPTEYMCSSLTSIVMPNNISYRIVHDMLKQKGFIVYAGQGDLDGKIFRVGNMGTLTTRDIDQFLVSLRAIFDKPNRHPFYT